MIALTFAAMVAVWVPLLIAAFWHDDDKPNLLAEVNDVSD
jgi:hypothetical protein